MKTIIETNHLRKEFVLSHFPKRTILACDDINIKIKEGEVVGIVGESGSGKSTLALCMSRLMQIESGNIIFENKDISALNNKQMRPFRKNIQLIFQDPYSSLNPRMKVKDLIAEGVKIHKVLDNKNKIKDYVLNVLEKVGLSSNDLNKFPKDFSGGQRQRIAIARALAVEPRFMICDEPVSALDMSIQAQIINLLKKLNNENNLSILFISHDLSVVNFLCDRVYVMQNGRIIESGTCIEIFKNPKELYTEELLSSSYLN
jgi:oligopeptide transport system ATP-binding protein